MKKYIQPTIKSLVLDAEELMDDLSVSVDSSGTYDGEAGAKAFEYDEEEDSPRKTIWDE